MINDRIAAAGTALGSTRRIVHRPVACRACITEQELLDGQASSINTNGDADVESRQPGRESRLEV